MPACAQHTLDARLVRVVDATLAVLYRVAA